MRTIAIDWSGARKGAARKIWIAEARGGDLIMLENGRDRERTAAWLVTQIAVGEPVIAGLDFAFSLPAWFLRQHGYQDAPILWAALASGLSEEWLESCERPFWGRKGKRKPTEIEHFRRTEQECARMGYPPKSVFQIGYPGSVGTGSLRGMPILLCLREGGFSIWPFEEPGDHIVIEIYPRLLTGPVEKSSWEARRDYLRRSYPTISSGMSELAGSTEDSFDAAISALVMDAHRDALSNLPAGLTEIDRLEGRIWAPPPTTK